MTNEEKEKIRIKYEHLLEIKKEILKNKDEIEMLEQDPTVRRYLELKEILESDRCYDYFKVVHLSNEMILEEAIKSVRISSTNGIFICSGTYKNGDIGSDFNDYIVSHDAPDADFRKYINIELPEYDSNLIQLIPISECAEFEQNNIVLYPPKEFNSPQYYSKIRMMYFNTAVKYGCEKAVEKVLYRRNMQQSFQKKDNN